MKYSRLFSLLLVITPWVNYAQVVTTDPLFPTSSDAITLIFDASQGNGGLEGFSGNIWAHTGVITDKSSSPTDWKFVIAGWSENISKAQMIPLGNNLWKLEIGPSIRAFYGVPEADKILKLAFVFRNSDGSITGRMGDGTDIFADVYEEGLNVSIVQPATDFIILESGSSLDIEAQAIQADSLFLYHDGTLESSMAGNSLQMSVIPKVSGVHQITIRARRGTETAQDSILYMVRGGGGISDLPQGVRDGINYLNDSTTVLVLYAPGKEFVFAIGDFTNWEIRAEYMMSKTPDHKRFWIEITGLEPQKEYVFQYLIEGTIRIADPYTDKVLDPWNDHGIEEETFPNLIAYPYGKTSQAASVLQTAQPGFPWTEAVYPAPPVKRLVIYEVLLRDFLESHTFESLRDTLKYLKDLGINAIELMPVNEFEGNESWGYNPSFYFAVDKNYGPKNTFKAFVDAAHQEGMAVIMDMVLNHSYGQSPLVRMYWDSKNNQPAGDNPWYNPTSPNPVYAWGYDFNHESEDTKRFVDSVNSYWITEYHVDGFRYDFSKGFTNTPGDGGGYDASRISILKRMADHLWSVKPDAYVILEHFTDNREEKELAEYGMMIWGNINHSYRYASQGWLSGSNDDLSSVSYAQRGWDVPHLVGYMESHDEERMMYECEKFSNTQNPDYRTKDIPIALQRMELSANLFIPIPGPKMIWMFSELGYDYSINYNGRVGNKPIRWDYFDDQLRRRLSQVYAALNELKTGQDLFSTQDFSVELADTVKRIHLNSSEMNATILGNFWVRSVTSIPHFQHSGWWFEYWTGDSVQIEDVTSPMTLGPGEYRLYTDKRLTKPDILSGISPSSTVGYTAKRIHLYPNPTSKKFHFYSDVELGEVRYQLLDIGGRVLQNLNIDQVPPGQPVQITTDDLTPGVYFIDLQGKVKGRIIRWNHKVIIR